MIKSKMSKSRESKASLSALLRKSIIMKIPVIMNSKPEGPCNYVHLQCDSAHSNRSRTDKGEYVHPRPVRSSSVRRDPWVRAGRGDRR